MFVQDPILSRTVLEEEEVSLETRKFRLVQVPSTKVQPIPHITEY